MRWMCGSSFFDGGKNGPEFRREFARIWSANVAEANPPPTRVVVISEGGSQRPDCGIDTDVVKLTGDCGHCEQLVKGERDNEFSGWSASVCALAMLAYSDMANLIFVEEDCLCFGDWVGQLHRDMGDGDMAFGAKMKGPPWMPCSQSLFIVRHSFLPTFVSTYLSYGGERDRNNLGETKFVRLEKQFGSKRIRRHSLPCDRERPISWDAPAWHCQQWTPHELNEARARNLI